MKKKIMSILSMIAVMTLCTVTGTYAWGSLNQTALNEYVITTTAGDGSGGSGSTEAPDHTGKPGAPDQGKEPSQTEKPGESQPPSAGATAGTVQNGRGDLTTGDTCRFVFYMVLMLLSFAVASVLGAVMLALLFGALGRKRGR